MALEINHETNDIVNSTGEIKVNGTAVGGDNTPKNSGDRGVFGGGNSTNVMDYITIANTGNATDFGDLSAINYILGGCSNGSRGLFGGGYAQNAQGSNVNTDTIEYITIASTGNVTDFGNLTAARRSISALSNGTRGCFSGGFISGDSDIIDFVTISTTGNATDFGDLIYGGSSKGPTAADTTRGVIRDNYTAATAYSYITIATAGNATEFGSSATAQSSGGGCADSSRALFAYGEGTIEYLTIQTIGNATDFGDLTDLARYNVTGTANASRGVFAGGQSAKTTMDYVTIQTTANAQDFGDLTVGRYGAAGLSGT